MPDLPLHLSAGVCTDIEQARTEDVPHVVIIELMLAR
jgi:hypothetical protein